MNVSSIDNDEIDKECVRTREIKITNNNNKRTNKTQHTYTLVLSRSKSVDSIDEHTYHRTYILSNHEIDYKTGRIRDYTTHTQHELQHKYMIIARPNGKFVILLIFSFIFLVPTQQLTQCSEKEKPTEPLTLNGLRNESLVVTLSIVIVIPTRYRLVSRYSFQSS